MMTVDSWALVSAGRLAVLEEYVYGGEDGRFGRGLRPLNLGLIRRHP